MDLSWEMDQLVAPLGDDRRRRKHEDVGRRGVGPSRKMHKLGFPAGNGRGWCELAEEEGVALAIPGRYANWVRG